MAVSVTDPDAWYREYERVSREDRYKFMLQTILQPLSEDFLEGVDIVDPLLDLVHRMDMSNRNPELIFFIERLQTAQPDLYRKEFYYFDQYLVDYYLYLDQMDRVGEIVARHEADPVSGIDYLIKTIDLLKLYQKADLVVGLCDSVYRAVEDAPGIIKGTGDELGETVFFHRLEQLYRRMQDGQEIDWQGLALSLAKFGYDNAAQMQTDMTRYLGSEVPGPDGFLDLLRQHGRDAY